MNAAFFAVPLLVALQAPDFEALKKSAEPVESVAKAISIVVGNCDAEDIGDRVDCQENIKKAKKDYVGKRVYVYLGAIDPSQLKYEGDRGNGKVRVVWTAPIYDAGRGLALTLGKPTKVSPAGGLVIRPAILDGKLPDDIMDSEIPRLIRTGQLAVEVVGKFKSPWALSGKGRKFQGAEFTPDAIRLTNARTGKTVMVTKL